MLNLSEKLYNFIRGEWKTILLSVLLHVIVFILVKTIPVPETIYTPPKNRYVELGQIPEQMKQFTANPEKVKSITSPEKLKDSKAGLRPDKVVRLETGKPGGSVTGFNGEGGEALGTKGVGEGAGNSGQGGTGEKGSDIYRVGVEEMPEPYGGKAAIISKIPPNTPDFATAKGKSIYILAFIDESGIVRKAQISKGTGSAVDLAAANAVRKTRFKPGKDKGKIVKVQLMLNLGM